MAADPQPVDLVLSGGGVLGIAHVGAVSVLAERGYVFERLAGTSAGAIVSARRPAGRRAAQLAELLSSAAYKRFAAAAAPARPPLLGPPLSVVLENGYAEGRYFSEWLAGELEQLGVRTFGDLRRDDPGADPR